ncbi:MAG TPA: hypothetical protein VFO16_18865 [Pseudonocardiaceae bacterium]|nr:hypothetical protein [Pseudonocardiaceae bacterium]
MTGERAHAPASEQLTLLPQYALTLGHDITGNVHVLNTVTASISST